MCTLPLLAGENVSAPLRRPDRRRLDRPRRARGARATTGGAGSARSSPSPAGSRATSSRSPTCSSPARRCLGAGRRLPAARRPLRAGRASTCPRCSPQACRSVTGLLARAAAGHRAVPRLVELLGARGATAAARATGRVRSTGWRDELRAGGLRGAVRADACSRASVVASLLVLALVPATVSVLPIAAVLRRDGRLPRRSRSSAARARRRRGRLRELWPEAVDNLASAVRAGLSLPEALVAARHARAGGAAPAVPGVRRRLPRERPVRRLPRPAQGAARRPGRRPPRRERCGSPARSAAATSATCCARCRASCARTPAPAPSSRPGRAGRSTPPGWPWPRRGSCSPCCRRAPSRSRPTPAPPARACCSSAAPSPSLAYRVMLRIGRLPEDERVLR